MASTVWKGQLGFGLVSIPIRLSRAARKERIRLRYLAPAAAPPEPDDEPAAEAPESRVTPIRPSELQEMRTAAVAPVVQTVHREDDPRPIERSELRRGHEVSPGQYVTFEKQDLQALRRERSTEMQIVRSVRL